MMLSPSRSPSMTRRHQESSPAASAGEVSCQLDAIDIYVRGQRKHLTGDHFLKLRYRPSERTLYAGHNWFLHLKEIVDIQYKPPPNYNSDNEYSHAHEHDYGDSEGSTNGTFHIVTNTEKQWKGEIISPSNVANPRVRQQKERQLAQFHFLINKVIRQWTRLQDKKQKYHQQQSRHTMSRMNTVTNIANNGSTGYQRANMNRRRTNTATATAKTLMFGGAPLRQRNRHSDAGGGVLASRTALPAVVSASKSLQRRTNADDNPMANYADVAPTRARASPRRTYGRASGRTKKKPLQTELDFVFASDSEDGNGDQDDKGGTDIDNDAANVNGEVTETPATLDFEMEMGNDEEEEEEEEQEEEELQEENFPETKEEIEDDAEEDDEEDDIIVPARRSKQKSFTNKRHRNTFVESDDEEEDEESNTKDEQEAKVDDTLYMSDTNEQKCTKAKTTCPPLLPKATKVVRSKRRVLMDVEEEEEGYNIADDDTAEASLSGPKMNATPSPTPTSTRVEPRLAADLLSMDVVSEDEGGKETPSSSNKHVTNDKSAGLKPPKKVDLTNFFAPRGAAAVAKKKKQQLEEDAALSTSTQVQELNTTPKKKRPNNSSRFQSPTTAAKGDTFMDESPSTPSKKETQTLGNTRSSSAFTSPPRDATTSAAATLFASPPRDSASKRSGGGGAGIKRRQQYGRRSKLPDRRGIWSPSRRQQMANDFSPAKQLDMVALASNNSWESPTKVARKSYPSSSNSKAAKRPSDEQDSEEEEVVVRPLDMALFRDQDEDNSILSLHSDAATDIMEDPAELEDEKATPLLSNATKKDAVPLLSQMFARHHKANAAKAANATTTKRSSLVRPRLKGLSPKRNIFSSSNPSPSHKGMVPLSSPTVGESTNSSAKRKSLMPSLSLGLRAPIAASLSTAVLSLSSSASASLVPVPKPLKMVGLRNMGNSCYLNAALQMFMTLSPRAASDQHGFITDLQSFYERSVSKAITQNNEEDQQTSLLVTETSVPAGTKEGTLATNANVDAVAKGVMPLHHALVAVCFALQRRKLPASLALLYGDNPSSISPSGNIASAFQVKRAMDALTATYVGHEQHDSHEFVLDLLDLLQQEEEAESSKSIETAKAVEKEATVSDKENTQASTTPLGNKSLIENKTTNSNSSSITGATESNSSEIVPAKAPYSFSSPPVVPVDHYFTCEVEICLTCSDCGYARTQAVSDRHLSLDLLTPTAESTHANKQQDAKHANATNGETFGVFQGLQNYFESDTVSIACEKEGCNGSSCRRDQRIKKLPAVLLLHLKRFKAEEVLAPDGDGVEMVFVKNNVRVEFPAHLSLASLVQTKTDGDTKQSTINKSTGSSSSYKLRSVVHHIGDCAQRGHYTTDAVRTPLYKQQQHQTPPSSLLPLQESKSSPATSNDQKTSINEVWTRFDDGVTKSISEQEALESEESQRSAYIVLYEMES